MRGTTLFVVVALAIMAAPVLAQTSDYRSADPRALVKAWAQAPQRERGPIAEAIIARRAQSLPALWEAARFGTRKEKVFACGMIAEMRDRDGVDALVDATGDGDVAVRRRAATALRILADPRSAPRLRVLVRTESDLGVLMTTLAALGKLGQARDVRLIVPFLTHADAGVRVVAAGALAMLGDERGLAIVLAATGDADPGVQKNATYALGLFKDPAAAAKVEAILADPNAAWRAYALLAKAERALAGQTPQQQLMLLDQFSQIRSRTVAEWAVDRLTDLGGSDAEAVLRKVTNRPTPAGALAARRLAVLGAQP